MNREPLMRIEQTNPVTEILQPNTNKAVHTEYALHAKTKCSKAQSVFVKDSTYLNPALEEKKNILDELVEETSLDATARKNQMAVLAHTTSEEDYAKMQKEGFSLDATSGGTVVTVIDKIKAQIAKGGGDISCFGDGLTREQLEELVGNKALAAKIQNALKQADLPDTKENVDDCMKAYILAENLEALNEGGMKYMLDNELEPTIENLYKATYSGSSYYTTPSMNEDLNGMQTQIEEVIRSVGVEVNEQTKMDCQWLLANEITLTPDHLSYLQILKEFETVTQTTDILSSMAEAITEGKRPKDAMLLPGFDLKSKAEEAVSIVADATDEDLAYLVEQEMELSVSNLKMASNKEKHMTIGLETELKLLTAKRQLEEVRLCMTAEANYALLKRGISIDTKPLEELVVALRKQEQSYYESLLSAEGIEASKENVELFVETTEKVNEIKTVPAYVLGMQNADVTHINGIHTNGTAMKAALEKANQSYETLMSTPRKDLGDSYEKAFRNVDDLLVELNIERTEENRRAVRILAYNELEITEESLLQIKACDEEVQRVFKNLTPHVVLEMIRRGENPLEMDFSMIQATAEHIREELDENDTERFSEYLWKLEHNHRISKEERSTYVGIYRLLRQVEQTDGAVVGALLNQGRDLTLKNLLTAIRSLKKQTKMDYAVDDTFGEQQNNAGYRNSIIDQIMIGYQTNCVKDAKEALTPDKLNSLMQENKNWMEMTPEQFARALTEIDGEDKAIEQAYFKEQLNQLKQCSLSSHEVYQMLEQYEIPNTVQNVLAMDHMMRDWNGLFKKLFDAKKENLEAFGEAVSSPEEMAKAQETLAKVAENAMKTLIDGDEVTAIDIREARLMQARIQIHKKMAEHDTYSVPVLVGDEVTNITLKIVNGVEKRGRVDILLESRISGKIAATFQAKEHRILGTIVTDDAHTKEGMLQQLETFKNAIVEKEEEFDLKVAFMKDIDLNQFIVQQRTEEQISNTRLYRIAESFIRVVKEYYE